MRFVRLSVLLVVSVSILLLGTIALSGTIAAAKDITLTLLWRAYPAEVDALKEVITLFEQKNPGIRIKLVPVPYGEYDTKLALMQASDLPVDLFSHLADVGMATYALKGMVRPVDDLVARDKFDLSDFLGSALDACKLGGKLYGLPLGTVPTVMYYNVDMFEAVGVLPPPTRWDAKGWNWPEFVDTARKLTKDTNGDGRPDIFGVSMSIIPATGNAWLWGGDWFEPEAYVTGIARRCTADSPETIRGHEEWVKLAYSYRVMPAPGLGESAGFGAGRLGMEATGGWMMADLKANDPGFKWSIAPLPRGTQRKTVIFVDPLMITSWCKYPNEAWEFVKFATGKEAQAILHKGYLISARRSLTYLAAQQYKMVPQEALIYAFFGAYDYGLEDPGHRIYEIHRIGEEVYKAIDEIEMNRRPASMVLKEIAPRVTKLLEQVNAGLMKK